MTNKNKPKTSPVGFWTLVSYGRKPKIPFNSERREIVKQGKAMREPDLNSSYRKGRQAQILYIGCCLETVASESRLT